MTDFYTWKGPDEEPVLVRTLSQSAMLACPHVIMMPEHYREDETCRCDDPNDPSMASWGYHWNETEGKWV